MPPGWTESFRRLPVIGTVALLAVVPYLNSLRGTFVFDDVHVIEDNSLIMGEQSSALRLLLNVHQPGHLYRPLTMLSYRANALVDTDPFGFHLVNVILHAAVSLGTFALSRLLLGSTFAAAVAACLFAVHAIHTEAVANIVGRAELLAALFTIVSLLAFNAARNPHTTHPAAWRSVSIVAFLAGLLSKESAFTALGLYPIVHWRVTRNGRLGNGLRAAGPYAAIAILYLTWRVLLIGSLTLPEQAGLLDNPLAHVSTPSRIGTALVVLWEYLAQLLLPLHLSADYSHQAILAVTSVLDARLLGAIGVLGPLAIGIAAVAPRCVTPALCLAFALVPMALTANIFFPIGTIKAERLLYLPSLGFCMAVGWLAGRWNERGRERWPIIVICVFVVVHAGRTWVRNLDWQSNDKLFIATVQAVPESGKAQYNAGWVRAQRYELDEALAHFRRALAIHPEYPDPAFWIGQVYRFRDSPARALFWYEQGLARDWSLVEAHYQIGVLRYELKEYVAAETAFRSALESEPDHSAALLGLSLTLHARGDRWTALTLLDRVRPEDTAKRELRQLWTEASIMIRGELAP